MLSFARFEKGNFQQGEDTENFTMVKLIDRGKGAAENNQDTEKLQKSMMSPSIIIEIINKSGADDNSNSVARSIYLHHSFMD